MRTKFLTLVALLVAGAVRADVVIENTTGGGGESTASVSGFTISFTNSGTSATLSTFKLFSGVGNDVATFTLTRITGGATFTDTNVTAVGDLFTFSNIANAELTNSSYTLAISGLDANYNYNGISAGTTPGVYGFSGASQSAVTGSQYLNYQLSAVPEPGTAMLAFFSGSLLLVRRRR